MHYSALLCFTTLTLAPALPQSFYLGLNRCLLVVAGRRQHRSLGVAICILRFVSVRSLPCLHSYQRAQKGGC